MDGGEDIPATPVAYAGSKYDVRLCTVVERIFIDGELAEASALVLHGRPTKREDRPRRPFAIELWPNRYEVTEAGGEVVEARWELEHVVRREGHGRSRRVGDPQRLGCAVGLLGVVADGAGPKLRERVAPYRHVSVGGGLDAVVSTEPHDQVVGREPLREALRRRRGGSLTFRRRDDVGRRYVGPGLGPGLGR